MATIKELETQLYNLKQELAKARQESDPEPVKNYTFQTPTGDKKLIDLFGDKTELFVIHNMGESCSYCTHWADTLEPTFGHIAEVAKVVLCTPDDLDQAQKFAKSRNWNYDLVNDIDRTFTRDMGYIQTYMEDGKEVSGVWPGISAFRRETDGSVVRLNHTSFGPTDDFCPTWHLLDLIQESDWQPN